MTDLAQRLKLSLKGLPRSAPAENGTRPAAVLAPLVRDNGRWKMLFTKRTDRVESHKGQVSFPGGVRDPEDESHAATALRETEEEIGVARGDVELVGRLSPIVTVTNYLVYPFVGIIPYPYPFKLNRFEVARLLEVDLDQLVAEARAQTHLPPGSLDLEFNQGGEVIWGATARILYQLLEAVFLRKPSEEGGMIECPICAKSFDPEDGIRYLAEIYCSEECAKVAAEEGRNTAEMVEGEEKSA